MNKHLFSGHSLRPSGVPDVLLRPTKPQRVKFESLLPAKKQKERETLGYFQRNYHFLTQVELQGLLLVHQPCLPWCVIKTKMGRQSAAAKQSWALKLSLLARSSATRRFCFGYFGKCVHAG